jgi:hypothetical protein
MDNDETALWLDNRRFAPVSSGGVPTPGLDFHREYQFMREEWSEPQVFRLADLHPAMNMTGLMYREIS